MSRFSRHYKGLMRKNYLTFKQTKCCTSFELFATPLFICFIMFMRIITKTKSWGDIDLSMFQHALYQPTEYIDGDWRMTMETNNKFSDQHTDFMKWANFTNDNNRTTYSPIVDFMGPVGFHPVNCFGQNVYPTGKVYFDNDKRKRPIIAYVKNDNQVEKDVISQIQAVFETKQAMYQFIDLLVNIEFDTNGNGKKTRVISDEDAAPLIPNEEDGFDPIDIFQFMDWQYMPFDSYEAIENYIRQDDYMEETRPGICFGFNVMMHNEASYEVELYFNDQSVTDRYAGIPDSNKPSWSPFNRLTMAFENIYYSFYGFSTLQHWIADNILKQATGSKDAKIVAFTRPFYQVEYFQDDFRTFLGLTFPFFVCLGLIPILYRTSQQIASENSSGIRDYMETMAVHSPVYWLSWFSCYTIKNTFISLVTLGLIKINCLPLSDPLLIFLWQWIYGEVCFASIVIGQAIFYKNPTEAALMTCSFHVGQVMFCFFMREWLFSYTTQTVVSIFPFAALFGAADTLVNWELVGLGLQFVNMSYVHQNFSFTRGILMLIFDFFLWHFIGFYLDGINCIKSRGQKFSLFYCFKPSFWCEEKCTNRKVNKNKNNKKINPITEPTLAVGTAESNKKDSDEDLQIKDAKEKDKIRLDVVAIGDSKRVSGEDSKTKQGDSSDRVSQSQKRFSKIDELNMLIVDDLNKSLSYDVKLTNIKLRFHLNSIHTIVGHYQSGKTSLLGLFAHHIQPDSGKLKFLGYDYSENFDKIRAMVGVCYKTDRLFKNMTAEDHISVYFDLKKAQEFYIKEQEIEQLMVDFELPRNTLVDKMNLKQRRFLSIALSFCGTSKLVLLDEPTEGLKFTEQNTLWRILQRYKKDKVIVITTRSLNEGLLSDRVSILHQGKIVLSGSSTYVQERINLGYKLIIQSEKVEQIQQFLANHLIANKDPRMLKLMPIGAQKDIIGYRLPTTCARSFRKLLPKLDEYKNKFQIKHWELNLIEADEIFFNLDPADNFEEATRLSGTQANLNNSTYSEPESEINDSKDNKFADIHKQEEQRNEKSPPQIKIDLSKEIDQEQIMLNSKSMRDKLQFRPQFNTHDGLLDKKSKTQIEKDPQFVEQSFGLEESKSEQGNHLQNNEQIKQNLQAVIREKTEEAFSPRSSSPSRVSHRHTQSNEKLKLPPIGKRIRIQSECLEEYKANEQLGTSRPLQPQICDKCSKVDSSADMDKKSYKSYQVQKIHQANNPALSTSQNAQVKRRFDFEAIDNEVALLQEQPKFEIDRSWFSQFIAMVKRQLLIYKRNKFNLFKEVFLPVLMIIVLITCIQIVHIRDGRSHFLEPSMFPNDQRLYLNNVPVNESKSNMNTTDFFYQLPDQDIWNLTWLDEPVFFTFMDKVFEERTEINVHNPLQPYIYGGYQFYSANTDTQVYEFISYVNMTSQDAVAAYPQFMYESIMKIATNNTDFEFKMKNRPLPVLKNWRIKANLMTWGQVEMIVCYALSIPICIIIKNKISDRLANKHYQSLIGMNMFSYWSSSFVFDVIKLEAVCLTCVWMFEVFETGWDNIWRVLIPVPLSLVLCSYAISFCFNTKEKGLIIILAIHHFFFYIIAFFVGMFRLTNSLEVFADNLNKVLRVFPQYPIASAIYYEGAFNELQVFRERTNGTAEELPNDLLHPENMGGDILFVWLHLGFWIIILFVIELSPIRFLRRFCHLTKLKPSSRSEKDTPADVKIEEEVTEQCQPFEKAMRVFRLRKFYKIKKKLCGSCFPKKTKKVIDSISFSASYGECFTLLGQSKSGKSTVYKMLTNEITHNSGEVSLGGNFLRTQFASLKNTLGCAPYNCILEQKLTVLENLQFFAKIKGFKKKVRGSLIKQTLKKSQMESKQNELVSNLKDSQKMRLQVAVALMGCPSVIMLDEPTHDMDPESVRIVWKMILDMVEIDRTVFMITSKDSLEAEHLSKKIGMLNMQGQFQCIGNNQQIRAIHDSNQSFELELLIKLPTRSDLDNISYNLLDLQQMDDYLYVNHIVAALQESTIFCDSFIELYQQEIVQQKETVLAKQTLNWIHTYLCLSKILHELCKLCVPIPVQLIYHCSYKRTFRLRIPRKKIVNIAGLFQTLENRHKTAFESIESYRLGHLSLSQLYKQEVLLSAKEQAESVMKLTIDYNSFKLVRISDQ